MIVNKSKIFKVLCLLIFTGYCLSYSQWLVIEQPISAVDEEQVIFQTLVFIPDQPGSVISEQSDPPTLIPVLEQLGPSPLEQPIPALLEEQSVLMPVTDIDQPIPPMSELLPEQFPSPIPVLEELGPLVLDQPIPALLEQSVSMSIIETPDLEVAEQSGSVLATEQPEPMVPQQPTPMLVPRQPVPVVSKQPTPMLVPKHRPNKYHPNFEINLKAGNKKHVIRPGLLIPIYQQEDTLAYFVGFGMAASYTVREGNLGLGYRTFINPDTILGSYVFYDMRKTAHGNHFHQFTAGVEWLKDNLELRGNIYLPQAKKHFIAHVITPYQHNNIRIEKQSTLYEKALPGADFEIGGNIPRVKGLSAYVAFYKFGALEKINITGVRGRLVYKLSPKISLEGEVTHDKARKTSCLLGVKISLFPTAKKYLEQLSPLEEKMNMFPERDMDVVTAMIEVVDREYPIQPQPVRQPEPVQVQQPVQQPPPVAQVNQNPVPVQPQQPVQQPAPALPPAAPAAPPAAGGDNDDVAPVPDGGGGGPPQPPQHVGDGGNPPQPVEVVQPIVPGDGVPIPPVAAPALPPDVVTTLRDWANFDNGVLAAAAVPAQLPPAPAPLPPPVGVGGGAADAAPAPVVPAGGGGAGGAAAAGYLQLNNIPQYTGRENIQALTNLTVEELLESYKNGRIIKWRHHEHEVNGALIECRRGSNINVLLQYLNNNVQGNVKSDGEFAKIVFAIYKKHEQLLPPVEWKR